MNWLYGSLKLLSIIASAFFAALALLTKYKDDSGQITLPGKIALGGIVGTAALSAALYVLDVRSAIESAQKSKMDAVAAAERQLTPLGPMRIRIRVSVPAAQLSSFRDRIASNWWGQPYAMPLTTQQLPANLPEESVARNFFGLIMIAVSVDNIVQSPSDPRPQFGKLLIFGLPMPNINLPAQPEGDPGHRENHGSQQLFYDKTKDEFILELQTSYFADFDSREHFLSFRDFANKSLRLAFNVRERLSYGIELVEIESRSGNRRIWVKNFREEASNPNTFIAAILPNSFVD